MSKDLGPERDEKDAATLSELFDNAFELFNSINKTQEPTNSSKVQVLGIEKLVLLPASLSVRSMCVLLHASCQKRKRKAFDFYAL